MNLRNALIVILFQCLIITGCAPVYNQTKERQFSSLSRDRFSSKEQYDQALQLSTNKCRALALTEASRVREPNVNSVNTEIYVQNITAGRSNALILPQPYLPDFRQSIEAYQVGQAHGFKIALIDAVFTSCMNQEGFIEIPAPEVQSKPKI